MLSLTGVSPAAFADPGPVTITAVAPAVAAAGTSVQVTGTGFMTTPGLNAVAINGRPASVTAATDTSLSVTVATGTTSGPVTVSNGSGTAVAETDVYVPPPSFTPLDIASTGRVLDQPVVAVVSAVNKVALLTFSGSQGGQVALQLTSGTFGAATSNARITVYRPNGTAFISATGFANAGLWLDKRVLPETGTYTVLIDPQGTATGQVTVQTHLVPPDAAATTQPGGAAVTVGTTVPGQNAGVTFAGAASQKVSLTVSNSTFGAATSSANVSVLKPDGSSLVTAKGFGATGLFLDTFQLPTAGTYTVLIDPQLAVTGTVNVRVHDATEAASGTVLDAAAATMGTGAPGQNGRVTFSASANQRVSIQLSNSTYGSAASSASVSLLKPDGSVVIAAKGFGSTGIYLDTVVLPTAGTYAVFIDPGGSAVGQVDVKVVDTEDTDLLIAPGDPPVTTSTAKPGQNSAVRFAGSAGDRISVQLSSGTYGTATSSAQVSIKKPDGGVLVAARGFGNAGTFLDSTVLPSTGIYTLYIDPQGVAVGSVTSQVHAIAADASVSAASDGTSTGLTLTVPGQNGAVSFAGEAGQRASVVMTGSTFGTSTSSATMTIVAPNGATVVTSRGLGAADVFTDAFALPSTGTYKILIDPAGATTGTVTARVYDLAADPVAVTEIDGQPVQISTSTPGQNASATFAGQADQRISFNLTQATFGSSATSASVTVLGPDGSTVMATRNFGPSGTLGEVLLPSSGLYRVVINPASTGTGSVTLQVYDIAENRAAATPDGDPVTVLTNKPGQNAAVSFDGATGQRIYAQLSGSTFGASTSSATVSVLTPAGAVLVAAKGLGSSPVSIDTFALPTDGKYRIFIDPQGSSTGEVRVQLRDVPPDDIHLGAPSGEAVDVTTSAIGQNGAVVFSGILGQRVSLELTDSTYGPSSNVEVSLRRPDGTNLVSPRGFGTAGLFIEPVALPTSGQYQILVNPLGSSMGQVTVKVHAVPVDDVKQGVAGGDPVTIATSAPGQNAAVSFSGVAGRRASVEFSAVTYGYREAYISLNKPDGSALVTAARVDDAGSFFDVVVLPTTGTYTVRIDPIGTAVGGMTVQVFDVPVDSVQAAVVDGAALRMTNSAPGHNTSLTFAGNAGDKIRLEFSGSSYSGCCDRYQTYTPSGLAWQYEGFAGYLPTGKKAFDLTLPETGTYRILIDPWWTAVGEVTVVLYHPAPDVDVTAVPGGGPVDVETTHPGQNAFVTFQGEVGQEVGVQVSGATFPSGALIQVFEPDGSSVTEELGLGSVETNLPSFRLTSTAPYRLSIDPQGSSVGQATVHITVPGPTVVDIESTSHPDIGLAYPNYQYDFAWGVADSSRPAAGYSVVVSSNPLADVDTSVDTATPHWTGSVLLDGIWWLHVRAVDATGNWGEIASRPFIVDGDAAPPAVGAHELDVTGMDSVRVDLNTDEPISALDVDISEDYSLSRLGSQHLVSRAYNVNLAGTDAEVASATITVPYSLDALGTRDPSTLRLHTYDSDAGLWRPVSSVNTVNQVDHTVTAQVSRLSTVAVIPALPDELEDDWPMVPAWCGSPTDAAGLDVAIVSDVSGSMYVSDPEGLRVSAERALIDQMDANDRVSVITFNDLADVILGPTALHSTADRDLARTALHSAGAADGGTNLTAGIRQGIRTLTRGSQRGRPGVLVVVTDGFTPFDDTVSNDAALKGIPILTFRMGTSTDDSILQEIARATGGRFTAVDSGDDLAGVYESLRVDLEDDGTDTDDDEVSDCIERRGALISYGFYSNDAENIGAGRYVRTDPDNPDTDGDLLTDGEELGAAVDMLGGAELFPSYGFLMRNGIRRVWNPASDPRVEDTEVDALDDPDEIEYGTDAFDWDTDNDTLSDGEEVAAGGELDPLVPDEYSNIEVPGVAHGTILVPDSFGTLQDPSGGPDWPAYLTMNYDPDSNLCTFESPGCGTLKTHAQDEYQDDGGGSLLHDLACGVVPQCDNGLDYERQIVKAVVRDQGWFDADGHLTSKALARFIANGCAFRAAVPDECTDSLLQDAADEVEVDHWDDLLEATFWVVSNLPSGSRPNAEVQKIATLTSKVETYLRQALAELGPRPTGVSARTWGNMVHNKMKSIIDAADEPEIWAEYSYRNGAQGYGLGSTRPDVVLGSNPLEPLAIIDLKTGARGIAEAWIRKLQSNLPTGWKKVPIIRMNPDG